MKIIFHVVFHDVVHDTKLLYQLFYSLRLSFHKKTHYALNCNPYWYQSVTKYLPSPVTLISSYNDLHFSEIKC